VHEPEPLDLFPKVESIIRDRGNRLRHLSFDMAAGGLQNNIALVPGPVRGLGTRAIKFSAAIYR
jgi:hypothetical protein